MGNRLSMQAGTQKWARKPAFGSGCCHPSQTGAMYYLELSHMPEQVTAPCHMLSLGQPSCSSWIPVSGPGNGRERQESICLSLYGRGQRSYRKPGTLKLGLQLSAEVREMEPHVVFKWFQLKQAFSQTKEAKKWPKQQQQQHTHARTP